MRTTWATLLAAVFLMVLPGALMVRAGDIDGVIMKDGKMMLMKRGKATAPLRSDFRTHTGTTVRTNGSITASDGTITHLENGQMMMMDGKIMTGGKATGMTHH